MSFNPRFLSWWAVRLLSGAVLLSLAGCGDHRLKLVQAAGTLTLDDKPIGPANLLLFPMRQMPVTPAGEVDDQGKVKFTTYATGDGIPAGEYRVFVTPPAVGKSPIPAVYCDDRKSPLIVKVLEDSKEVKLAMNSSAGPPRAPSILLPGGEQVPDAMEVLKTMRGTQE